MLFDMKKLMMVLLCMGFASAWADEPQMHLADQERILSGLPAGMVATCSVSDGRVDILIDTYQTDWATQMLIFAQHSAHR